MEPERPRWLLNRPTYAPTLRFTLVKDRGGIERQEMQPHGGSPEYHDD